MNDIKEKREKLQISQVRLAELTGIPRDRIAKWEQGKGQPKLEDSKTLDKVFVDKVPNASTGYTDIQKAIPVFDTEFTAGFQDLVKTANNIIGYIDFKSSCSPMNATFHLRKIE